MKRSEYTLDELRALVLQAAETIVAEEGFAKLKVRNLALEIDCTVGSIYTAFDSMADLVLHLKARTLDTLMQQLQSIQEDAVPNDCLQALVVAYVHFAMQHSQRWRMLFTEHTLLPIPAWYQLKTKQLFAPVVSQFERLAPEASAEQITQAAYTLWSGVQGICLLGSQGAFTPVNKETIQIMAQALVDNFVRGWLSALNPGYTVTTPV